MRRTWKWLGLVAAVVIPSCGGDEPGPSQHKFLTERLESAHGVYYYSPGDHVDVEAQEAYYEWLFPRIGIEPPGRLVLFKYRDRAQLEALTGTPGNWAEIGTLRFHTIWEWDNHECVHALVSATLGLGPALLNEGFAVAHQTLPNLGIMEPVWSGTHIDTLAARFKREDRIPPLAELLTSADFFRYDTEMTYPMAGSFVRSLLKRHGYAPMREFFRSGDFYGDAAEFRADFRGAFGEEIEDAWAEWLAGLDT